MYIQNGALENTSLLEELFGPNKVPFNIYWIPFSFIFFDTRSGMYQAQEVIS